MNTQGASVRVDIPFIAQLKQSITQPQQGDRPTGRLLTALLWPDLKQFISQPQHREGHKGRLLTALLWPNLKKSITQPQQGDGPTGSVDSPSMARPESIQQSTTAGGADLQGAPVSVASPSMARPEAIHHSTTAEGRTHRAIPSGLTALLLPDLRQSFRQLQ
jgi:hypothetical protein